MNKYNITNEELNAYPISRQHFNEYTSPAFIAKRRKEEEKRKEQYSRRVNPNTAIDPISTIYPIVTSSYDKLIKDFSNLQKHKNIPKPLKKIYHLY